MLSFSRIRKFFSKEMTGSEVSELLKKCASDTRRFTELEIKSKNGDKINSEEKSSLLRAMVDNHDKLVIAGIISTIPTCKYPNLNPLIEEVLSAFEEYNNFMEWMISNKFNEIRKELDEAKNNK